MIEIFESSLKLINSEIFLNNSNSIYLYDFKIVNDIQIAIEYAQSQQLSGAANWAELEEKEDAKLNSFLYSANYQDYDFFVFWSKQCKTLLISKIASELKYILDEIIHDLYCIGINNHFANAAHKFYSTLETVYKLGGWPCGWAGDYPEGTLVVYAKNPLP